MDRRQTARSTRDSALRFDADAIIDGTANPLLAAEVPLGRSNGDVPEEKLNLLQFAARRMAEPRTRATKIVRPEPVDAGFASVLPDHVPDGFLSQSIAQTFPFLFTRRNSLPVVR